MTRLDGADKIINVKLTQNEQAVRFDVVTSQMGCSLAEAKYCLKIWQSRKRGHDPDD